MIKKQKKLIIILVAVFAVLLIGYFAIVRPLVSSLEEEEAPPELIEGELLGSNNRILMMEHITKDRMKEIEVHNSYGSYSMYRSSEDNEFYLRGNEGAPYDQNMFSSLIVSAGYTLTVSRVVTDCEDFSEYGLAEENNPAWYKITLLDGGTHTVYIGSAVPSGSGYYCRYEDRPAVYILDTSIASTLLSDVTNIITPILSYPVSAADYSTVDDFYIRRNGENFLLIDYLTEEEKEAAAWSSTWMVKYPGIFAVNSDNYSTVLQSFEAFQGSRTVAIGNTAETMSKEELLKWGIDMDAPAYELHYKYAEINNFVFFSEKTENNTYYAYSLLFNLVAEVDQSLVAFLDWGIMEYVDNKIFTMNINDIAKITVSGTLEDRKINEEFILKGEANDLEVDVKSTGKTIAGDELYNFRQFYKVLLMMGLEHYSEVTKTDGLEKSASVTVETDSGIKYEFDFYPYSTRRAFYTTNGSGIFYTLRDTVDKLLSDAYKAANGITVNPDAKN